MATILTRLKSWGAWAGHGVGHFFKECWPAFIVLAFLVWGMAVLETTRPFEYLKAALIDAFTRSKTLRQPDNLVIVEISEEDYKRLFQAKSPLNADGVFTLIKATQQLHPSVIGVDLDTSEPQWACLPQSSLEELKDYPGKARIVWAQVPVENHENDRNGQEDTLKLAPVLGGLLSEENQIGLVRFPQDADGYVRAFQSSYAVGGTFAYYKERPQCQNTKDGVLPLTEAEGKIVPKAEMPTFFQVIAQAHHEAHEKRELKTASTELKYLRFRDARYSFMIVDASQLLDKNDKGEFLEKTLDAAAIDRLDHPMVLIGGSYPEARDEYYTPLGPMLGVELLANAVEAQLGESTSVVSPARTAIMDVIAGLFIILIYYFFGTRPMLAVGLSLSAMVGVVAFGSFIFYSQIAAFLNFVPVMLGMWIHQMIEGTREAVHLRHELNAKETRIVELEQEQALLKAQHPVIAPLAAVPASATANEMAHSLNPKHPGEAAKAQHAQAGKTKPHHRGHAAGKSGS